MTGSANASRSETGSPVCVIDTCIGGLSVVKSLWKANVASDVIFVADYAVNPLGTKSETEIADVVNRWIGFAEEYSEMLFVACNTLSIRYRQLIESGALSSIQQHVVSMVDCVDAMCTREADRLAGRRVLILGTEYTASQPMYPQLLACAAPGAQVDTAGATDLERGIARFDSRSMNGKFVLTCGLRHALDQADVVVLGCTCFPMVRDELVARYPAAEFLDPAAFAPTVIPATTIEGRRTLRLRVTGDVVSTKKVESLARRYLGCDSIEPV